MPEKRSNFLTDAECDHIVSLARPHLERSGVVDSTTGGSQISDIRTSQGTFLDRGQDETISTIEERIARWTLLPAGNGEGLQVLVSAGGGSPGWHATTLQGAAGSAAHPTPLGCWV